MSRSATLRRAGLLGLLLGGLALTLPAAADSSAEEADSSTEESLEKSVAPSGASAATGETLALPCGGCHGPGSALGHLGELSVAALREALDAYANGTRPGTLMPRLARGYDAAERAAIARALGAPASPGAGTP
ncbi:MAG: hypothetical protein AAGI15_15005 [Pseudomonadota bacterium]